MRIPRIFTDQPLANGQEIKLDQKAARHLVSVLRFGPGDKLILFNGKGGEHSAHLLATTSKQASAQIGAFSPGTEPSPLSITLAIGLSRGDRMDWLVQKAVELGVAEIIPLFSERCEVKLKGERAAKKTLHWQEIAHSACEQSGQNLVPTIRPPITLQEVIANKGVGNTVQRVEIILDPLASHSLPGLMSGYSAQGISPAPKSALVLSGPEGGFSAEEIAFAEGQGVFPVSLGPRVLRTETAPIAALSVLQAYCGDWL